MAIPSERRRLEQFIAKFTPEVAANARAILDKVRELVPGALELVYDNYNWLVIGFTPNERPSDAVFSIIIHPRKIALAFLQSGTSLSDPSGLLRGSGKRVRSILLEGPETLDASPLRNLIGQALALARAPFDPRQSSRVIIRAVAERQRPRRP